MTAGVFGAVYTLTGLVGFAVTGFSGNGTLIVFDLSVLHNIVHLAIGLAGLAAFASGPAASRMYAQVFGVALAVVAVLGIVVSNPLALLPIGGGPRFLPPRTPPLPPLSRLPPPPPPPPTPPPPHHPPPPPPPSTAPR